MKKYNINLKDSSTLNFKELYTVIMKKARCIKFKHNLMKTMRESALKELNHQKELFIKIDTVIVYADDTFLSLFSTIKFAEKSKSKIILNAVIQCQLNDLNLKAEIL